MLVVLSLLLTAMGSVFAAPPEDNPGKKPANFDKVVFVHYPKGNPAKGGIPGRPVGNDDKEDGGGKEWYKYSGLHWADSSIPVPYRVNSSVSAASLSGIQASFQTWEDDPDSYIDFEYDSISFTGAPSSFIGDGSMNENNEVGWVSLTASYPNAIAVTLVWYDLFTNIIVEVDMAMNDDFEWSQAELSAGADPNLTIGNLDYYDVQNIATHEVGHWLMLGDMYNKPAGNETMYGYGAKGELKKRSLESGDLAGVQTIYSGSSKP